MKRVVLSQRVDVFPERKETRDATDQQLTKFLLLAGFIPLPMPNVLIAELPNGQKYDALDAWLAAVNPVAVVLSGGNDIGQCMPRDLTENHLLNYAEAKLLPLLGICRGMHMMAHWAGTGLNRVEGHIRTMHSISGEISGVVNSYHAFSLKACPRCFDVLALSDEDGEIEAIRHKSLPWEGWMWHPERNDDFDQRDVDRLKQLFGE